MDSGKKSFLWMVALFVTPILLGTLLFFNLDKLGLDKGSVNYGTLIQPAFPLKTLDLKQADSAADKTETIAKRWTLAYVETGQCDQACQEKLILINKIRLLTNDKMRRVRTLLISGKNTLQNVPKDKLGNMVFTQVDGKDSAFLKQFPAQETNPVYLIDPYGNVMMYYPQEELNAKKVLKDLGRLLKYSQIG